MSKTMTFDVQNIVKVYDGDTITVMLDRGFHDYSTKEVRLKGVDTPERRFPTKAQGVKVGQLVQAWLNRQNNLTLISYELDREKYGRCLGDLISVEGPLTEWLINSGLARRYLGGERRPWTAAELQWIDEFRGK